MNWIRNLARIIVGLVFVFSGFVKGVDPLGTAYRIEDYFIAYHMDWAVSLSLGLSVFLCAFEFSLGIFLLLNLKPKLVSWLTLLLMTYFTILTFFDALYNPVPDCGCFGDAIKLTNWETFYKNIVLIILVILIFVQRKKFRPWLTRPVDLIIIVVVPLLFMAFSVYNYRNLPMKDFTAWKPGTKLIPDTLLPQKIFVTYKDVATGELKEFLTPDYPYNDSVWMANHEFVQQRIEDPNQYAVPNFHIIDTTGNDLTKSYLQSDGYLLFLVSVDLTSPSSGDLEKLNAFYDKVYEAGYTAIGLTGSLPEDVQKVSRNHSLNIPWNQSDDTELKAMVRSNPGLVLLKDGAVVKKWHIRNLPGAEAFIQAYPLQ